MATSIQSRIAEAFIKQANAKKIDLSDVERDVDLLSSRTEIESFDVNELAITLGRDGSFSGEGVVYLLLQFPDHITLGEELPVNFDGRLDARGKISFDQVKVDLSPLAGGEAA